MAAIMTQNNDKQQTYQAVIPIGIERLIMRFEQEFLTIFKMEPTHDKEWFGWHPFPMTDFFKGMTFIRDRLGEGRLKFCDVGSGIGTKLFLADHMGFEPQGIELNEQYVNISRRLFSEYSVQHLNALDADFSPYDVVYSYRIAKDDNMQEQVNKHIVDSMKDGAIYFANDTKDTLDKLKVKQT